jgi:hypothetical protein
MAAKAIYPYLKINQELLSFMLTINLFTHIVCLQLLKEELDGRVLKALLRRIERVYIRVLQDKIRCFRHRQHDENTMERVSHNQKR